MRLAAYLKGGGAKGAFQAGVITALYENGIKFNILSGTSIGSFNGYFILKNKLEYLKKVYLESFDEPIESYIEGKTINNSGLLEILLGLKDENDPFVEKFYVNYVKVENSKMSEVVEDIASYSNEKAIERIKWSSSLPYNLPKMSMKEYVSFSKENNVTDIFIKDLTQGNYDGLNLDGGLYNNNFIYNILDDKVDKIIIIGYNGTKQDYLKDLRLSEIDKEKIIYISSKKIFLPSDTMNFSRDFLKERFLEGYNIGKAFKLSELS